MLVALLLAMGCFGDNILKPNQSFCWPRTHLRKPSFPDSCPANYDRSGLLCYPECRTHYTGVGPLCLKNLDGPLHLRLMYGRTAGRPMKCGDHKASFGICYPSCGENYVEYGPVCYAKCHHNSTRCGLGCAATQDDCQLQIWHNVEGNVIFWSNVAAIIATAYGVPFWTTLIVPVLVDTALLYEAEKIINNSFNSTSEANQIPQAKQVAHAIVNQAARGSHVDWGQFDPSGVTQLLQALYRPLCDH